MSRTLCNKCTRPVSTCICRFISHVDNEVKVVILQHKSELKQAKATVPLLANALSNCEIFVGEDFTEHTELNKIISLYGKQCFLVYPAENAIDIPPDMSKNINLSDVCLILLDGTWKKSYLMFMLSKNLHLLDAIKLPDGLESQYQIRSTTKENALSTLEACYHCLINIEDDVMKYQTLINDFIKFNEFQLSFIPKEHYK